MNNCSSRKIQLVFHVAPKLTTAAGSVVLDASAIIQKKKASANFSENLDKNLRNEILPSSSFLNIIRLYLNLSDLINVDLSFYLG